MRLARDFAAASAGKSIAAKMAMMPMTTNSSIKVKADRAASGERRSPGIRDCP
jgi:hypothetical protein